MIAAISYVPFDAPFVAKRTRILAPPAAPDIFLNECTVEKEIGLPDGEEAAVT
jgi:hypothetical protein